MSGRLINEADLRRLLRQPAGTGADAGFEAAVLDSIRREKRRSALLLAGLSASVAVVLSFCLLALVAALSPVAGSFANVVGPFVEALKPLAGTAEVWIECALATIPAAAPRLAELALCLAALGLAALILLEIGVSRLLFRSSTLQIK